MPLPMKQEGMAFPSRQEFLGSWELQPTLPFRKPMIDYILKSPKSPQFYQKLIKCCKIFFLKNPILVIRELNYEISSNGWNYCLKEDECTTFCCKHKDFDMTKLACKIWITGQMTISEDFRPQESINQLLSKLYKCDVNFFYLNGVDIGLADLKLVSSNIEGCYLNWITVTDKSDNSIPLEDLLEIFSPAIKVTVTYSSNNFVKDYKKLVNICSTIRINGLYQLDDEFDADIFVDLLDESNCKSVIYYERTIDDYVSTWTPVEYYESGEEAGDEYEDDDDSEEEEYSENEHSEEYESDEDFAGNDAGSEKSEDSGNDNSSDDENESSKASKRKIHKTFCNLFSCFTKTKPF